MEKNLQTLYGLYSVCYSKHCCCVNTESTPVKVKNKTGCLLPSLLFNKDLETKKAFKKRGGGKMKDLREREALLLVSGDISI